MLQQWFASLCLKELYKQVTRQKTDGPMLPTKVRLVHAVQFYQ